MFSTIPGDEDDEDNDQDVSDEEGQQNVDLVGLDENNLPCLPKLTKQSLEERKKIIREYITLSYREWSAKTIDQGNNRINPGHFTSNPRAVVHWNSISSDNDLYMTSDSVPDGVVVRDPSKLKLTEVAALWEHWRHRQSQGLIGLEFIKCQKGDMREKDRKGKKRAQDDWMDDEQDVQPSDGPSGSHQPIQRADPPSRLGPLTVPADGPSGSHSQVMGEEDHSPAQQDRDIDEVPDASSPAAHRSTKKHRMAFLKTLSTHVDYQGMLKSIHRLKASLQLSEINTRDLTSKSGQQYFWPYQLVP
jgi:hypothetical protein